MFNGDLVPYFIDRQFLQDFEQKCMNILLGTSGLKLIHVVGSRQRFSRM